MNTLHPAERILLGPGPSPVSSRVLRALAAPTLGHLDPQYVAIMDEVCGMLRQVFRTANPGPDGQPRWVLAAGELPPADLALREDLRTRLGWGHVFALQVLDEPARRAVLRQQADARGVFLGDEVMDFMLNRFSRDLGSLMQLLDHLDHYALQTQRAITIPLIKSMLENE